jgi:hypothetical protein
MVKTIKMLTMDNPQPSPKPSILKANLDAVQRLDVGGGERKFSLSLKV